MTNYSKLVRDGIPKKIESNGEKPITRTLEGDEFEKELIKKLKEETDEFVASKSAEELADIQEVLREFSYLTGSSPEQVEELRREKAECLGGFSLRVFLEDVEQ